MLLWDERPQAISLFFIILIERCVIEHKREVNKPLETQG